MASPFSQRTLYRRWLLLPAVLLFSSTVMAQSSDGYVVVGIGSRDGKATSQAAVGAEWPLYRGAGVAGEIGAVMGHNGFAVISLDGLYQFPVSDSARANPFISAGYTAAVDLGAANMFNVGVGVNYWFLRRIALRTELRDFVRPNLDPSPHFWAFRFGIAFR